MPIRIISLLALAAFGSAPALAEEATPAQTAGQSPAQTPSQTPAETPQAEKTGTEKGVFGLGVILGEPTGICGKLYIGDDTAVAAAAGYAPFRDGFHLHADFLWHPVVLESRKTFVLPIYIGLGGRLMRKNGSRGVPDHFRIGPRGVAGILFDFTQVSLDVFAEAAAILDLRTEGKAVGFDINASAGIRYYF